MDSQRRIPELVSARPAAWSLPLDAPHARRLSSGRFAYKGRPAARPAEPPKAPPPPKPQPEPVKGAPEPTSPAPEPVKAK